VRWVCLKTRELLDTYSGLVPLGINVWSATFGDDDSCGNGTLSDNLITFNDMEAYMNPFRGVNKYCETCKKECKQFKNTKVAFCPNVIPVGNKVGKTK